MKCKKCGEEIKTGNLYCSKCGTEVQMVSAYNVMEDEFLLDFQNEQMSAELQNRIDDHGTVIQKKNLYLTILVSLIGFILLLFLEFFLKIHLGNMKHAEILDDQTRFVKLLSDFEDDSARELLESEITNDPEEEASYFWLAWLCGRQNDRKGQVDALQQILKLDKENVYACRKLIRVYVDAADFDGLYQFYDACAETKLSVLFSDYLVEVPDIQIPSSAVRAGDTLTILAKEGLNIYYTVDGSSPITNGTLYYAPIKLEAGELEIKAAACNENGYYSRVVSEHLTVQKRYQLGMPSVTPNSGEYLVPQTIYINVPEGCTAYYTWNGSNPTTASKKYNGRISMPEGNNVLSVILVDEYGNLSSVQRVNYIYMPQ